MKVYHITDKSINFFLKLIKFKKVPTGIDRFVEVEYKPQDHEWAKIQFMSRHSQ